jgi:hypothetical protein
MEQGVEFLGEEQGREEEKDDQENRRYGDRQMGDI